MRLLACAVVAAFVAVHASVAAAPVPLSFVWPTSVEVEPGGSLLVVENGLHRLVRVSPAGRVTVVADLRKPYAVARTRSGHIYVTDGPVLRRIDGKRAPVKVARAVSDIGPIAVAPNGDVYFTTELALWKLAGGRGKPIRLAPETQFSVPHGLAVAPDGSLLVGDTGNHRILRVDPRTGKARLFHVAIPHGMDVAADGTVYFADAGSNRVVHLSATGKRLGFVGPVFDDPYALRFAPGGALYVVESLESGDVKRIARDGTVTTVSRG
jgi:DNA-binding beta-propeller fold protein YncE